MNITGKYKTSVGSIIQGATITFDPPVGESISFTTDINGFYSKEVPPGSYRVLVKHKYSIEPELLGANISVGATGSCSLEEILDQVGGVVSIPSYTLATLPNPTSLNSKAIITGNFAADVTAVLVTADYIKGVLAWTGTVVSAYAANDADGLPDGITWVVA